MLRSFQKLDRNFPKFSVSKLFQIKRHHSAEDLDPDGCGLDPFDVSFNSPNFPMSSTEMLSKDETQRLTSEVEHILQSKPTYPSVKGWKFTEKELTRLLSNRTHSEDLALFKTAASATEREFGNETYFRGIAEFSNKCEKDCKYCGIRRSQPIVQRFDMSDKEVVDAARWVSEYGYGCLLLQSGERKVKKENERVSRLIRAIKKETKSETYPKGIGIILSVGEQKPEVYKEWFDLGAHRYLLRIETTNRDLYHKIHPSFNHSFDTRVQCLKSLRDIGYQVGSGVMIGIPGQSILDLARDLLWYREMDLDMIGMGPYIHSQHTPMCEEFEKDYWQAQNNVTNRDDWDWHDSDFSQYRDMEKWKRYRLALRMIALTRLMCFDCNIAATTALQAIDPFGRERALEIAANVVMPIVTPKKYRKNYVLYDGKPCVEEDKEECRGCLQARVTSIGKRAVFNQWNDPPHFLRKQIHKK
ncbi:3-methylornithine synthase [Anaeramoeba flamelloides]|uniref:3-methylornithine synthase n=1 Tax=Anaeramoeba flamelloides TaxID=1746091 RepID=A0ABQ8YPJ3_9EUKA|nr:3-methylornithine synthase [Anaeramoeba flamelloides]